MAARLAQVPAISLQHSIRHAAILLVAGPYRDADRPALRRLHDQLPHPRATVWWGAVPLAEAQDAVTIAQGDHPVARLRRLDRNLLRGERASEPDWLPDEPPNEWRGKGDHGQGGEGMMGGVPYGRPMAMMGEEMRDALMLDAMTITIGPFLRTLPPGLSLELTLQGDVIQQARVVTPAYPASGGASEPLLRAARMLESLGLPDLARRAQISAMRDSAEGLLAAARRCGALLALPAELADVRARLEAALRGGTAPDPGEEWLVDRLAGMEWQSALLRIASFDPATLAQIAPAAEPDEDEEDGDEKERAA
ncbi:hypothetical protein D6851_05455 [Altericroceibacterium spongiae]|uniref:Uncharacterized protein n=1 Tax=Altericroceibacterium spongiae TaxID=2320269 RepID=A0A420EPR9_9SPHN|nr:hypothetical protein [Altericroceibacterium spongiae]RKF22660.1 hypothetical protein D6851_05455 [Altericroceibacterium spongiae]